MAHRKRRQVDEATNEGSMLVTANELRDQYQDLERSFSAEKRAMIDLLKDSMFGLQAAQDQQMIHAIVSYAWPLLPAKVTQRGYEQFVKDVERETEMRSVLGGGETVYLQEREAGFIIRSAIADVMTGSEIVELERVMHNEWKRKDMDWSIRADGRNHLIEQIERVVNPELEARRQEDASLFNALDQLQAEDEDVLVISV